MPEIRRSRSVSIPAAAFIILIFCCNCGRPVPIPSMPVAESTPALKRVSTIDVYNEFYAPLGSDNYFYEPGGRLVSHTSKDGFDAETTRFFYEYGPDGRVTRLSCYKSGALAVRADYAYNEQGRIIHSEEFDARIPQQYSLDFIYNSYGFLIKKNICAPGSSVPLVYFDFTPNSAGLYTRMDIMAASGTMINRITQGFNPCNILKSRHFYDAGGTLLYYSIMDMSDCGTKTDLWYYDAAENLIKHGIYHYEAAASNLTENDADKYEMIYLDTGVY